ncbi:MAG TPA: 16S rRNA (cytosine(1402)-N(4))-methyltransferase RsmH [Myxococcota bacterium]|nr:16S rRNA (cytosine(1402)-N(4))-methyltransferase RsmH [Myxococcota bacterium]HNZ02936.1 16S rRNA (cytosine(1402)-N(4))-methyltransferase RsmH [Myxococcota bacterium]HOD07182.1 16S rRNA (cytosine(1402)-N(4))-methyltransferase RsmH [Myxococcota bacterium]HPB50006.1 16S rRNA (cytosine(1402)-N(4))-methyltransferase RsmH [Myxococcota bacterium]HQP94992.1 16S rRNA (cytosine(1402)-N(4))-methyltransferase RsmH [Myxococcota bacterium]
MPDVAHISVMQEEVITLLRGARAGWIVDGTVGQGGHSRAILAATPIELRVLGFDRDPQAIAASRVRLAEFGDRFVAVHAGYETIAAVVASMGISPVVGILLDLGLSSTQLGSDRGFSFSGDSSQPLDMRFDPGDGVTAADVIMALPIKTLAERFRELADVPMAGRLARILKEEAGKGRMQTVGEFVDVCHRIYGPRIRRLPSPTLPAQALRMMVNSELERLSSFFDAVDGVMAPGGTLVAISFHSGEDRIVKHSMRRMAKEGWSLPFVKPMLPSPAECETNSRSKCARLRAAVRCQAI